MKKKKTTPVVECSVHGIRPGCDCLDKKTAKRDERSKDRSKRQRARARAQKNGVKYTQAKYVELPKPAENPHGLTQGQLIRSRSRRRIRWTTLRS